MSVGTRERPIKSVEPMEVARAIMRAVYGVGLPKEQQGVYAWEDGFLVWYGGERWVHLTKEQVWNAAALWMESVWYEDADSNGTLVVRKMVVEPEGVDKAIRMLRAVAQTGKRRVPWTASERFEGVDPGLFVSFKDCVVGVHGGVVKRWEKGADFVDTACVPCEYEPGAECPVWMRSIEEWSQGDEGWKSLLQRWMGYCLMGTRRYQRWMLFQGKKRGGKGTICKVIKELVGGVPAFLGVTLQDLGGEHGTDGLQHARVLSVGEANFMGMKMGNKVASLWKNVVGQDPIRVNAKYVRQFDMETLAAPMMSANMIPEIPNQGEGISSKMLVLAFRVSYLHRENLNLFEELKGELKGIAAWALEGARLLEAETEPGKKWPEPESAEEVREEFKLHNSVLDAFLQARFKINQDGWVASSMITTEWVEYVERNKVPKVHQVPLNELTGRLVRDGAWQLTRYRKPGGGTRGVRGMSLRIDPDDER